MRHVKLVFALVLLAAVLAFVAGNTEPVTLRFLVWESPGVSLSLVAAGFFVLGILFTLLLFLLRRVRRKGESRATSRGPEPGPSEPAPAAALDPDKTHIIGKD